MFKFAIALCPILLVGIIGCFPESNQSSTVKPPSLNGSEKPQNESIEFFKPNPEMVALVGSWEGESFSRNTIGANGKLKSGAELRAEIQARNRMSKEERRSKETWYKFRLVVEPKYLSLPGAEHVKLLIEKHVPNEGLSQTEKTYRVRINSDRSFGLRALVSTDSADFVLSVKGSNELELEGSIGVARDRILANLMKVPDEVAPAND